MFSTKTRNIILALMSLCAAALIAIAVETTKGMLFEIRKLVADMKTSEAHYKIGEAHYLDAINKLKAAIETASAMNNVGQLQANAAIVASTRAAQAAEASARTTADGLVRATEINMHPETEMFDNVTGPLFGAPAKQIQNLNEKIVRLKRDAARGIDSKTRRTLSQEERAERTAEAEALEDELATVKETASKNVYDAIGMFVGGNGSDGLFGGLGGLFPSGNEKPVPRRILEEK